MAQLAGLEWHVERTAPVDEQLASHAHAGGVSGTRSAQALGQVEEGTASAARRIEADGYDGTEGRSRALGTEDGLLEILGEAPAGTGRDHSRLVHRAPASAQPEAERWCRGRRG
jgi:hypothetical protein